MENEIGECGREAVRKGKTAAEFGKKATKMDYVCSLTVTNLAHLFANCSAAAYY